MELDDGRVVLVVDGEAADAARVEHLRRHSGESLKQGLTGTAVSWMRRPSRSTSNTIDRR